MADLVYATVIWVSQLLEAMAASDLPVMTSNSSCALRRMSPYFWMQLFAAWTRWLEENQDAMAVRTSVPRFIKATRELFKDFDLVRSGRQRVGVAAIQLGKDRLRETLALLGQYDFWLVND